MKKHLFIISFGLLFILALASLYLEKYYNGNNNIIAVNNSEHTEYAAFSSSFYFIKNELQINDNNTLTIPSNHQMIRIILSPGSREKVLLYGDRNNSGKTMPSFFAGDFNKLSKKESVVLDNFVGYKFNALHQYLITASVVIFLIFITSILFKTKNH